MFLLALDGCAFGLVGDGFLAVSRERGGDDECDVASCIGEGDV